MKTIMVDLNLCLGCKTCEIQCATLRVSKSKELKKAIREEVKPISRITVVSDGENSIPIQCRQCKEPACLDACPTGAVHHDEESGRIVIEQSKCVGCWMCVMVCPFGVINPYLELQKTDKCDQCIYMDYPVCVDSCPTKALQVVETAEQMVEVQLKKKKDGLNKYILTGGKDNE